MKKLTFDSNIIITVNGSSVTTSPYNLNNGDVITATTDGGYKIRINGTLHGGENTININNQDINIVRSTAETFDVLLVTINYTETSQVSIDLTSLSGWNNVSDGEHNIQVVAKADGYRDSEKSTAVSFTKGSGGKTLTSSSIAPNNIEVNGTALTSLPYTLQNGDTIQVTYTLDDSAITVNGVKQTSNYQTYNLSNTDIIVEAVDGNIEFPRVTINYTA